MTKKFDILVISEINPDLLLTGDVQPEFGQTEKLVEDAVLTMGSSGVIFACGATRLGLKVALVGVVGDDLFGHFMLDYVQARGIDTSGVVVDPTLKTGLSVIMSRPQDRAILTYPGAIPALQAEQVNLGLMEQSRHVHLTSYYLQNALRPGLPTLLKQAQELGLTVSLDTNWDPSETWNSNLAEVLTYTDIFLPNEREACAISGRPNAASAIAALALSAPTVAIKLGRKGAIARRGSEQIGCTAFPVEVVDTTGAGDSFNAGFICGLLHDYSLLNALQMGCACGALSAQAAGGTKTQPTFDQVRAFCAERDVNLPPI